MRNPINSSPGRVDSKVIYNKHEMSQSLFRLSINTAFNQNHIKQLILLESLMSDCYSNIVFNFEKFAHFFFMFFFCFCSRIFCTFQVILWLFSFNFNFNCNRAQLAPQSVRLYCGSALRCQIKFSTLFVFILFFLCAYVVRHANTYICIHVHAYVSPRKTVWLFAYVFFTCLSILRLTHGNFLRYIATRLPFIFNFRRD